MYDLSYFIYLQKSNWFNQECRVEGPIVKYNEQMLKHSVKSPNLENGKLAHEYLYPFDEHDRWVNWAYNINE